MPSANKKKVYRFAALLEKSGEGMDAAYVSFPYDVRKEFGTGGQVKIKATFDGEPYRGSLAPMGGSRHVVGVLQKIRKTIGKVPGQMIDVTVEIDDEERVVAVPEELSAVLDKDPKSRAFFDTLSYTNRKEYALWISSAVKEETRNKRLSQITAKLRAGKKNPSEK